MSLSRFTIIVSCDSQNGVVKGDEGTPWQDDGGKFFKETTTAGTQTNTVIFGRLFYEEIPAERRPLSLRTNIVVSKTWRQEEHVGIRVASSFLEALSMVPSTSGQTFVCGGVSLIEEASKAMHLCDKIYVTRYRMDYHCTRKLPNLIADHLNSVMTAHLENKPGVAKELAKTNTWTRYALTPSQYHPENDYLRLVQRTKDGEQWLDGAVHVFGAQLTIPIKDDKVFVTTTKRIDWSMVVSDVNAIVADLESSVSDSQPEPTPAEPELSEDGETLDVDVTDEKLGFIAMLKRERMLLLHVMGKAVRAQFLCHPGRSILSLRLDVSSVEVYESLPLLLSSWSVVLKLVAEVMGLLPDTLHVHIGVCILKHWNAQAAASLLRRTPRPLPLLRSDAAYTMLKPITVDRFPLREYHPCL